MSNETKRPRVAKVRRQRSADVLREMLAKDGRNGVEISRKVLRTHAAIAGQPLNRFCASEKRAIQNFAINHDLQEVDCKPPLVKFKNPDNGHILTLELDELMEYDRVQRQNIRDDNKQARRTRRENVERLL